MDPGPLGAPEESSERWSAVLSFIKWTNKVDPEQFNGRHDCDNERGLGDLDPALVTLTRPQSNVNIDEC